MSGADFGELRSLLHSPPSAARWEALCALCDRWSGLAPQSLAKEGDLAQAGDPATLEAALRYAQDHLRAWPDALRVAPTRWQTWLARGEHNPALVLVRTLRVEGRHVGPALIERLRHEPLDELTQLTLRGELTREDLERLARWPGMASLRALDLSQCGMEDAAAMALLSAAQAWPALRSLELSHNRLTTKTTAALRAAPWAATLQTLRVEGATLDQAEGARWAAWAPQAVEVFGLGGQPTPFGDALAGLGAQGVAALLDAWWLSGARALHLNANGMMDPGASALGATLGQGLASLDALSLAHNGVGPAGVSALLRAPPEGLRALNLGFNPLGDEGARAIAALAPGGLRRLELFSTQLAQPGLQRLLQASGLGQLQELDLSYNRLDARAMQAWEDHRLEALRTLSLAMNPLGDEGLYALSRSESLGRLQRLNLANAQLGPRAMRVLGSSQALERLETLELSMNPLGDLGAQAIALGRWPASLRVLKLNTCQIGPQGALAIAQSQALSHLEELELRDNPLGHEGVTALAKSATLPARVRQRFEALWRASR